MIFNYICFREDYTKFNITTPNLDVMKEVEDDLEKEKESWNIFEEFHTGTSCFLSALKCFKVPLKQQANTVNRKNKNLYLPVQRS